MSHQSLRKSNYAGEVIPSREELLARCSSWVETTLQLPRYSFSDLFKEVKVKNRIEYYRNEEVWPDLYNNWSKDFSESQKHPSDQKQKNQVKGIYIFYDREQPVYVGISRKLVQRLKNHFLGTSHFQATLVYLMCRDQYDNCQDDFYMGQRTELPDFVTNRLSIQEVMRRDWKISILRMEDNYELYTTEVLLACELRTKWNSFQTH